MWSNTSFVAEEGPEVFEFDRILRAVEEIVVYEEGPEVFEILDDFGRGSRPIVEKIAT